MKRLISIITEQQKGREKDPIFMIGEQIKEIAERETTAQMGLKRVEKIWFNYTVNEKIGI